MYHLAQICCTCLKKPDQLINLTDKDSDGLSFADKFKICAFDFIFQNSIANQPLFICQLCCQHLKSTYNFRNRCLKNSSTFRGYICQMTSVAHEFPNSYFDMSIEISSNDVKKCHFKPKQLNRDSRASTSKVNNNLSNSANKLKTESDSASAANVNANLNVDLHTFKNSYSDLLQNMDNANESNEQLSVENNVENIDPNDPRFDDFIYQLSKLVSVEMPEDKSKTILDSSIDNPETFSSSVDDFDEVVENFDFETFSEMQENAVRSAVPKTKVTATASSTFKNYSNTGTSSKVTNRPKNKYLQYCKICNKHLSGNFQRHLLIHSGIKPYKCQECSRAFVRRDHLKCHINRSHTKNERMSEKKPVIYKCFECGKIFNLKSSMTNHLRTHNNFRLKKNDA